MTERERLPQWIDTHVDVPRVRSRRRAWVRYKNGMMVLLLLERESYVRYGPTSTHRYTTKLITLQFSSRRDKVRVRSARTGRRDAHVHSSCISPSPRLAAFHPARPHSCRSRSPTHTATWLAALQRTSARLLSCALAVPAAIRSPFPVSAPRDRAVRRPHDPPRVRGTDAHHGIYILGQPAVIARDHAASGSHSPCHHQPLQVDCATLDSKHK